MITSSWYGGFRVTRHGPTGNIGAVSDADWIAAIGTVGATGIAAGALSVQAWDRRRAIPAAVSGWAHIVEGQITKVVLLNSGLGPVYDVVARVAYHGEVLAVVSPDSLPPGEHAHDLPEPYWLWTDAADLNTTQQGPKVALVFRDAYGRVWRRKPDGRLRRQRRKYVWSEEYLHATNETPPLQLTDLDGNPVEGPYTREPPRF